MEQLTSGEPGELSLPILCLPHYCVLILLLFSVEGTQRPYKQGIVGRINDSSSCYQRVAVWFSEAPESSSESSRWLLSVLLSLHNRQRLMQSSCGQCSKQVQNCSGPFLYLGKYYSPLGSRGTKVKDWFLFHLLGSVIYLELFLTKTVASA